MGYSARKRRGKGTPTSIGTLVAQTAPGRAAATAVVTRAAWEQVAGVGFARRTRPERIVRGTLYVIVGSAGWAQELALHEPVIVARLKARGIVVDRLRFRVGDVEAPDRGGVYAPPREQLVRARTLDVPEAMKQPLEKVKDVGLRETLEATARAAARRVAEVEATERAAKEHRPRIPGSPPERRNSSNSKK